MSGPVGVVLAGGAGQRLGGKKACEPLAGRPLIAYPLDALGEVLAEIAVVAKPDTVLPELTVPVWREPAEPRHPLAGIVEALERAGGRPVLVCAVDLPLVGAEVVRELARAAEGGGVVVAAAEGRMQPLLGVYPPEAAGRARDALERRGAMRELAGELGARIVEIRREALFNVNTRDDVAAAEAVLASRT